VLADGAWRSFLLRRRVAARAARRVGACPPYELARAVAPRFGIPAEELDVDTAYMPQLRGTTELVLCPGALDFPRPVRSDRHYVESIDVGRAEEELHLPTSTAGRPLVYASLGSQLYAAERARRLLHLLVMAFRKRPSWHLVLSLGRYAHVDEFGALPENVFVYGRVPQLAVLRRARVMVTHGGLGSIKECIIHGVPMLVFPLAVDQPGNAARVVHHGLGLAGDAKDIAEPELLDLLDRLVHEDAFSRHAAAFAANFERVEAEGRGAALIERLVGKPVGGRVAPA
jgi:MGT family glycosyltransferase